jgi:hypothetical protein
MCGLYSVAFRGSGVFVSMALIFGGAVAGVLGVRGLLGRVGARCPDCGGRAVPRGARPVRYLCTGCGHAHPTRVWSNW